MQRNFKWNLYIYVNDKNKNNMIKNTEKWILKSTKCYSTPSCVGGVTPPYFTLQKGGIAKMSKFAPIYVKGEGGGVKAEHYHDIGILGEHVKRILVHIS